MTRGVILLLLVALSCSVLGDSEAEPGECSIEVTVTTPKKPPCFLSHKVLHKSYSLGRRFPGDKLLQTMRFKQTFKKAVDVRADVRYHGHQIHYVDIHVLQTSPLGKAIIVSGGLYQSHIDVAIYAFKTTEINYNVTFYGP